MSPATVIPCAYLTCGPEGLTGWRFTAEHILGDLQPVSRKGWAILSLQKSTVKIKVTTYTRANKAYLTFRLKGFPAQQVFDYGKSISLQRRFA
jgi:hypothetical protein